MDREMERERRKEAAECQRSRPKARRYPGEVETAKGKTINIGGDSAETEGDVAQGRIGFCRRGAIASKINNVHVQSLYPYSMLGIIDLHFQFPVQRPTCLGAENLRGNPVGSAMTAFHGMNVGWRIAT